MHEIELLNQKTVMRGKVDLLVKPPVRSGQRGRIGEPRAVFLDHVRENLDLLFGRVTCGEPGREPLKLRANGVELGHLVVVERCHDERAPVAGQQRLRLESLQRFPNRRARDAEPFSQIADKSVALPIGAGIDRFEDQRICVPLRCGLLAHRASLPRPDPATIGAARPERQAACP